MKAACMAMLLALAVGLCGCVTPEVRRVRAMPIHDVDLSKVPDGTYQGDFTCNRFTYVVQTTVKDHRIEKIDVVKNDDSVYALAAEHVVPEVIKKQTPNVDATTGATTTSKALLKAIENSLTPAARRPAPQ